MLAAFDGGTSKNPGEGGSGFIIDGKLIGFIYHPECTNNYAELVAFNMLLDNIHEDCTILGDSNYVIKSTTEYLPRWVSSNYTKADGGDVLNWEQWMKIDLVYDPTIHHLQHVKGHDGNQLNEICDELTWLARYVRFNYIQELNDRSITNLRNMIEYCRENYCSRSYFSYLENYLDEIQNR